MRKIVSIGIAAGLCLSPVSAKEITSFDLSDQSVRLGFSSSDSRQGRLFDAGILHHMDNGQLANVGLHALNQLSLGHLALGGRLYGWNGDKQAGAGIALGGSWSATVAHIGNPLGIEVGGYYAPNVTTFNDAKRLTDVSAQLYYQLMPNARAHIGYRFSEIGYDQGDQGIDRGWHLGMALTF